ncbi:MAG: GNAT family N-acetyltransferase [Caldilineae bacterium]|nr:GNAT family N-acetyltransferase [Chloroflexota bacterium]MCB9176560.1 GNAT family N-acetyltransferase [Caldilineae bacterium]
MRFPETFPELGTERLRLQALRADDAEALFAIFADPEVMRYWSRPPMRELAEAEALVADATAAFAAGDSFRWGLRSDAEDRVIGTCSLFHLDAQNGRAEIGYALRRPSWGQGLMQEALRAVIGYAFDARGLDLGRIEADLDPHNQASARLLERLGFAREGLLRERWTVAGVTTDSLIMGLLRREWRP